MKPQINHLGLRCLLLFALCLFGMLPLAYAGVEGTYRCDQNVYDRGRTSRLTYTLYLRGGGRAELATERSGDIRDNNNNGNNYGSIATVYLQRRNRVSHYGDWNSSGDRVNVYLKDIDGRSDRAAFYGELRNGKLRLNALNKGMYGRIPRFDFSKNGIFDNKNKTAVVAGAAAAVLLGAVVAEESRKNRVREHNKENKDKYTEETVRGEYTFTQRIDDDGGIRYRLRLEADGDVELTAERSGDPSVNRTKTEDYGDVLRTISDDQTTRHTGRFRLDGDRLEIELDAFSTRRNDEDESSTKKVRLTGKVNDNSLRLEVAEGQTTYGKRTNFEFKRDR